MRLLEDPRRGGRVRPLPHSGPDRQAAEELGGKVALEVPLVLEESLVRGGDDRLVLCGPIPTQEPQPFGGCLAGHSKLRVQ